MKSQHPLEINGEAIRLKREARGWTTSDLAMRACLSVKQVKQLEEGGVSSFYSESVKATTAKRVAEILGAEISEVFIMPQQEGAEQGATVVPATPAPAPNLAEVSELLQSPNTMNVVEEDEDPNRSRNWLIAMAVILAVAAVVLFKPSSQETTSVNAPALPSSAALPAASQVVDGASQAASGAGMSPNGAASDVLPMATPPASSASAVAPAHAASASTTAASAAVHTASAPVRMASVASASNAASAASAPAVKPMAPAIKPASAVASSVTPAASH